MARAREREREFHLDISSISTNYKIVSQQVFWENLLYINVFCEYFSMIKDSETLFLARATYARRRREFNRSFSTMFSLAR